MRENKISEKLTKIQSETIEASKGLAKAAGEGARRLSKVHASMANNVVKNIQLKSVEFFSSKSPDDMANLFDYEKSSQLMQEMAEYHKELHSVLSDFLQEISELTQEMFQNTKSEVDDMFNTICSNAPNGTDVLIRQYQSTFDGIWKGFEQSTSHVQSLFSTLDGLSEGAMNLIKDASKAGGSNRKDRNNNKT